MYVYLLQTAIYIAISLYWSGLTIVRFWCHLKVGLYWFAVKVSNN